jgi:hypothetical protein
LPLFFSPYVLFFSTTHAQSFRGKIVGTVTDQNGAVLVGAKVTAKNVGTALERTTITDTEGNFSIPELPIGNYVVSVEQTGFQSRTVTDVTVEVAVVNEGLMFRWLSQALITP